VDTRRKTFGAEATSRLRFLLCEHGFVGPEVIQDGGYPLLIRIIYHRSDLDVEESLILSYGGEEYVMASLVHSSPAPGPGHHTQVSTGVAHTGFQMRRALDRHAQELRELLDTPHPVSRQA
jgi:hypothetical protein